MEFYVRHDKVVNINIEFKAKNMYSSIADHLRTNGICEFTVKLHLCYITKGKGDIKYSPICRDDSNGALQKMKQNADRNTIVKAYWSVESSCFMFEERTTFGRVEYNSDEPYELYENVRSKLRQERTLGSELFELLVVGDTGEMIEIGLSNVHLIARNDVYVNFKQLPHPKLNYTIMRNFLPAYDPDAPSYYLATMKREKQRPFLKRLGTAVTAFRAQYGTHWDERVAAATKQLSQWSQSVPPQRGFNAATRQVVVQTMCRHVSVLTAHPVYIGVPQHLGVAPPAHMLGSGPMDVKIGAAVVTWARDAIVEDSDFDDEYDEGEDHGLPAAVDKNDPFPQLSGACYDAAFVSAEMQQRIAEEAGARADQGTADSVLAPSLEPAAEPVQQAHRHIGGFLVNGNAWEVLNYSTSTLEASAKPTITYLATLPLSVFRYTEEPRNNTSSVERDQVERVLAALVLGAQGRLCAHESEEK